MAEYGSRTGNGVAVRRTGIVKCTILWELESITFPWSYGLDEMHLFYLNIAPRMRDHWAGQYSFAKSRSDSDGTDDSNPNPYIISQNVWKDIEGNMERIVYPTAFGGKPRSLLTVRKAAGWKAWVKVITPIVLQGRLPEPYYREWINLVKAVSLATDYSI